MNYKKLLIILCILFLSTVAPHRTHSQTNKPFILPIASLAGPSTWLLGQPYGNTTGAYNFGQAWYSAGQGLHFGIDISMPCGTELVAVGDGEVAFVDNLSFGSGPHNLLIIHPNEGFVSLYGHLLQTPALTPGQWVTQGQVIALSGDPDVVCDSRPHLHYELRSLDYRTTYNPVQYINAPWHMLSSIGSFSNYTFQQDLDNARRWMSLDDQPDVAFGGRQLNAYAASWPLPRDQQPPNNPPIALDNTPLDATSTWTMRKLGFDGCCARPWWHPTDPNRLYVVDGTEGQRANIFEWPVDTANPAILRQAPPPLTSPDGTHEIYQIAGQTLIRRLTDGAEWPVQTQGVLPAISADNSRLLWLLRAGVAIPGQAAPQAQIWVSDINGENARQIYAQEGISASWIDASRLLITTPVPDNRQGVNINIYDTADDSAYNLGAWKSMRGLSIAPGGGRLMFYLTRQDDPMTNGVYVIEVAPGAVPQQLPWFGGWRWRDRDSVYYIPFNPITDTQTLAYYHIPTGENRILTDPTQMPFTIANGDWSVSPDGRHIVFQNALDKTMWLLENADSNL
jgi:hypothetical protein